MTPCRIGSVSFVWTMAICCTWSSRGFFILLVEVAADAEDDAEAADEAVLEVACAFFEWVDELGDNDRLQN